MPKTIIEALRNFLARCPHISVSSEHLQVDWMSQSPKMFGVFPTGQRLIKAGEPGSRIWEYTAQLQFRRFVGSNDERCLNATEVEKIHQWLNQEAPHLLTLPDGLIFAAFTCDGGTLVNLSDDGQKGIYRMQLALTYQEGEDSGGNPSDGSGGQAAKKSQRRFWLGLKAEDGRMEWAELAAGIESRSTQMRYSSGECFGYMGQKSLEYEPVAQQPEHHFKGLRLVGNRAQDALVDACSYRPATPCIPFCESVDRPAPESLGPLPGWQGKAIVMISSLGGKHGQPDEIEFVLKVSGEARPCHLYLNDKRILEKVICF